MKIYWSESLNDYVFKGVFDDDKYSYHLMDVSDNGFVTEEYWFEVFRYYYLSELELMSEVVDN